LDQASESNRVDLAVLEFEFPDWVETGVISERSFLTDFKRVVSVSAMSIRSRLALNQ